MDVGYIILGHRSPHQLVRLTHRLDGGEVGFFIHYDRSSDDSEYRAIADGTASLRGVRVMLPRHRCQWGGFGIVEGALEGLRAALHHGAQRVVLLSGQDYPLKPRAHIHTTFAADPAASYMEYNVVPRADWPGEGGLERFRHRRIAIGKMALTLPDRRRWGLMPADTALPGGLRPFQGGTWWSMSRDAGLYVVALLDRQPALVRHYRALNVADETFFQTILLNSPLHDTVVNDDLHFEDWSAGGDSPGILTHGHLQQLRFTPALFGRKFDEAAQPGLLDRIDTELLGF